MNIRSSLSKRLKILREALEPAKQSLDLVAMAIPSLAVRPGLNAKRVRRNDRDQSEIQRELAGFIALVRPIHEETAAAREIRNRT